MMIRDGKYLIPKKGDGFKATILIDKTEVLLNLIYVKETTALSYCELTREFYLIDLIELQKKLDVEFDPTEIDDENIKKAIKLVGENLPIHLLKKKRLFGRNIIVDMITAEDAMEAFDSHPYGLRSSLKRYLRLWDVEEPMPLSERYWKGLL